MEKQRYEGQVCWFDNQLNYGFVEWSKDSVKQKDLFLHYSDIDCPGFKTVKKGQRVSFGIGKNHRGDPKAIEVVVIK